MDMCWIFLFLYAVFIVFILAASGIILIRLVLMKGVIFLEIARNNVDGFWLRDLDYKFC